MSIPAIDTSGICFHPSDKDWMSRLDRLLSLTDLVMLDIKHIDPKLHMQLTGCSNENVLRFAHYRDRKKIPLWIRHVVVPTVTDNETYLYPPWLVYRRPWQPESAGCAALSHHGKAQV